VESETLPELLKIDLRVQEEQVKLLNEVRSQRSSAAVESALAALKAGAASDVNLMPLIVDAVRAYASVGEICNTLRSVFGEYKEHIVV
jgi:methylmalonyl-CoA mutase N-terminal domain/subunit